MQVESSTRNYEVEIYLLDDNYEWSRAHRFITVRSDDSSPIEVQYKYINSITQSLDSDRSYISIENVILERKSLNGIIVNVKSIDKKD